MFNQMVHTRGSRSSPIPPGVAALVSNVAGAPIYGLHKDNQVIIVQLPPRPNRDQDLEPLTMEEFNAARKEYYDDLEQIQMLLDRIEFGKTNWVYVVKHPKGGYDLVHKSRRKRQVTCHTWARLIHRREVQFTRFCPGDDTWIGYWNGHEVDVLIGLDDWAIQRLDRQMWGYQCLQGLDLTYQVYGHLVEDDGTVVGLVQEAHLGRLMQYRDRSIVYDAYSRLQKRGLIYCAAAEYFDTHVMDGKVRLPNLYTIWYFPDKRACKEQGDLRHWESLENHFRSIKERQDEPPRQCLYRQFKSVPDLLARFSPERPLFLAFEFARPTGDEEKGSRYKEIKAWLRKIERSRKQLGLLDHESTSRTGVIRRERVHRNDDCWSVASRDSHPSRRGVITSYDETVDDNYYDLPEPRSRHKIANFSDTDSETVVEIVSALAVNHSFMHGSRDVYKQDGFDLGWESEADTLVTTNPSSPTLS